MSKEKEKQFAKLADLKGWDKNPRDITPEGLARLKRQIKKLGVYKPLLVNQDNIVLGGNMRLKAFKDLGIEDIWVTPVETKNEQEMLEYALSDNDRAGFYNEKAITDMALEMPDLKLDDFALDLGKSTDLQNIVDSFNEANNGERDEDIDPTAKDLETYKSGMIKQIVLYFSGEDFDKIFPRLAAVVAELGIQNNSEAVVKLLEFYENHKQCSK